MPIRTRRWNDDIEEGDGFRLLVCRYRPRGVKKELETWEEWWPELGPSRELHAAYFGKHGVKIGWEVYRRKYQHEMRSPEARKKIAELAQRVKGGETVTLLCSSHCIRENRCHRSLLAELIEKEMAAGKDTDKDEDED